MEALKILVCCGGTGGHIFPAVAIADALKKLNPDNQILFVGANGRMEMEKVPASGYDIKGIDIAGLQRKFDLKNLSLPFKIIKSLRQAKRIIKEFKPDFAVGTGGYASAPTIYMAAKLNIPVLIQEQNSYPGVANKILAKRAKAICVAYPDMEKYFGKDKLHLLGNPIRSSIEYCNIERSEAVSFFGLNPDIKTVLVVGGSLGARTINQSVEKYVPNFIENNIQLIWQTGKSFEQRSKEIAEKYNSKLIRNTVFIKEMDYAYSAADVVVSRAGALSISEICSLGKPSILVPSPNVAEDHQTKNAAVLVSHNAAVAVPDDKAIDVLFDEILKLVNDTDKLNQLSKNVKQLAYPDSAKKIAELIYDIK
ncbi:MAG: undecaprenyldiphospho-muramoylpentapeptide beta-N-acetylglucosaminyltransferase [Bacteroidales bacterium]|jgi:UDP-N-acetylglucosamine--N-acetylmuramyl-(pentapeptide) pyrophosphoryl-undecaprenol N-acetylglucosamine transferase